MMIAALATLAFLATAWLAIVAIARTLEKHWSGIAAALYGQSLLANPQPVTVVLPRWQARSSADAFRPQPALRAAA